MEPNSQTNTSLNPPQEPTTTSAPQPVTPNSAEQPQDPKKSNRLIAIFSILSAIFLIIAAVFAYLYFAKSDNQNQTQDQAQESLPEKDPTTTSEEVELTDTYILRDLDEKIAILHNTTEIGALIRGNHYAYSAYILPLYNNGTLSDIAKLVHVASSLSKDRILTSEEVEAAIDDLSLDADYAQILKNSTEYGVNGDKVAQKYLDVFGEVLIKGATNGEPYCPVFTYIATYDFYYETAGCGGTSPYIGYYYKNKYTTDDDHAYVYVSVATFNAEDNNVYCGIISYNAESYPPVCESDMTQDSFTLNDSNYEKYDEYRFVFNKASDGTYYFSKVEKL